MCCIVLNVLLKLLIEFPTISAKMGVRTAIDAMVFLEVCPVGAAALGGRANTTQT